MTISVTVVDHETNDTDTIELVDFLVICNEDAGYYLTDQVAYPNGTTVLTIKLRSVEGAA